ncbi:MAG: hypothetical protein JKY15_06245 [Deltaproteobacteria bacterium]|nr:hypothetical protein [Deltaproteobacteria bacterium]
MVLDLPKLSKEDVRFLDFLSACSGFKERALAWVQPAAKTLSDIIGEPCQIEFKRVSQEQSPEITGTLWPAAFPPQEGLFWIETDTNVIQDCIHKMLDHKADSNDPKMSDLERGAGLYLLARVFHSTKESFQLSDTKDQPQSPLVCISLSFQVGEQNSFLRIWVSNELFESIVTQSKPSEETIRQQSVARTSWAKVPLSIQLASLNLSQEDFHGLEPGDIILLEESALQFDNKTLSGSIDATLGAPAFRKLSGALSLGESGQYALSLQDTDLQEAPVEEAPPAEEAPENKEEPS